MVSKGVHRRCFLKHLSILAILFFTLPCIQAQPISPLFGPNFTFEPGDSSWIFGQEVRLRSEPRTSASVIQKLQMGQPVVVVEKTIETSAFEGLEWHWYKVKTGRNTGYVLGGLLSFMRLPTPFGQYVMTLKSDSQFLYLKTRFLDSNGPILESIDTLKTPEFYASVSNGRGLNQINSLLQIEYLAEACGVDGGGFWLAHCSNRLFKVLEVVKIGDADVFSWVETIQFPDDSLGQAGGVVFTRSTCELLDEERQWNRCCESSVFLPFTGKAFRLPENF